MRLQIAALVVIPALLSAETLVKPDPRPVTVPQIVRSSGLIFSGEVIKVEHVKSRSGGVPAVTQITFCVEHPVRGVRLGQIVAIREWQGLWNSGERYVVGEHVMLFLYPNSRLGLTSPVGGPAVGRFRVDSAGEVLPTPPMGRPVKPINIRSFVTTIRRVAREQ